jgi:hypothetical protein
MYKVSGAVCVVVWCYTQGPADSCGGEWGSLMDEGHTAAGVASHAETCELGHRRHSRRIKPDLECNTIQRPCLHVLFRDTALRLTRRP